MDKLVFLLVVVLLLVTVLIPSLRQGLFSRKNGEWFLDGMSLLNHFIIIPFFQVTVLYKFCAYFFAEYRGILQVNWIVALALTMFIDYLWYWNHRGLHSRTKLWNFHMVHHAATHLDVLVTPRNTFWSPLLMVYMWIFSIVLFLAKDPKWFLVFSSLALIVNFWGHTSFNFRKDHFVSQFLSLFLITPREHFWHHSTDRSYCNFGTVFNFWDRIHGTWYSPSDLPKQLGFPVKMSFLKQAFFPFRNR